MKRQILTMAAVLVLVFAGAVFAQSPQNTTAPGPTTQREPGLTNNNLPNPGNPVALNEPAQEPAPLTEAAPETPVDTTAAPTDTTATAETDAALQPESESLDTTGTMDDQAGTADDADALPATASELPTMALIGLLALGAAFLVRARRHA